MSMLKCLKGVKVYMCILPSRAEHNAEGDFVGLEMQKWNIPMGRTQRVNEKNGLICLVVFSPVFIVIKMSEMAHFLYCLLMTAKNQSQFGQII